MPDKRIIYLEDDEEAINSLGDVLKEINYRVEFSKTSSSAEKLASKFEPDLFIVSMDITNSDPSDFINNIKKNKELKKIPSIFLSETFEEELFFSEFENVNKDISRFVKRPCKIEDLIDVVEDSIGLPTPPKGVFPISIEGQRELITIKKENEELRGEISELKTKLADHSKVIMAEKVQAMKDLQKELEKFKKEKSSLEEELGLLKSNLAKKEKEIDEKVKKANESISQLGKAREELSEIKKAVEEDGEKHKKAQNALREFYKPKIAASAKLEEELKLKAEEFKLKEEELAEMDKKLKKEKAVKDKLKKMLEEVSGD